MTVALSTDPKEGSLLDATGKVELPRLDPVPSYRITRHGEHMQIRQ